MSDLPNPKFAPRRGDLPWLRRRRLARPLLTESGPAHTPSGRIDVTHHGRPPSPPAPTPTPTPTRPTRAAPAPTPAPVLTPTPKPPTRTPTPTPARKPPARPEPAPAAANALDLSAPTPAPASSDALDLSSPTPAPSPTPREAAPAPASSNSLDLSAPTPPATSPPPTSAPPSSANSLDLSGPTPTPRTSAPPASSSTSLDLGGGTPAPPPAAGRASSAATSLDLGARPGATAPPGRGPVPKPAAPPERHHVLRRTRPGVTTLLDFANPVVTLSPVQSGVGELTLDAVVGEEVGDLRIGAAWALTDGRTGTVELEANRRHGPDDRRPLVWAEREGRFDRIALDLRQARSLARLLVYGFSPSRQSLTWGGTVVITTYGGDRIDAPIVSAPSPAVMALVSVYNVGGEFVVRAEMDPVSGSVRDTCRAFGYDRITWLDDRTPVV